MGYYTVKNANSSENYKGFIRLSTPKGDLNYPFSAGYRVVPPSAAVSATQMSDFYIGVDNPVEINAAGVQADQVSAGISNGSIVPRGNGKYVVRVRRAGTARVSVSAKVNGETMAMGSKEFRVKRIPDPVPGVSGKKSGGKSTKGALRTGTYLYAKKADGFDFDANFNVLGFKVRIENRGKIETAKTSGNAITGQQFGLILKLRPGGTVVFEDIVAKGPDGERRRLPPVVLIIQ